MKTNTHIKITKVCSSKNPLFPTPDMKDYEAGQDNGLVSLPADYTVKGFLRNDIEIGKPVTVLRYERNGVPVTGLLETTNIKAIRGRTLETENSVYIIEELS